MIDFVKSNAFLYDRKDADYNKNQKKNSAWEKISEILQNKSRELLRATVPIQNIPSFSVLNSTQQKNANENGPHYGYNSEEFSSKI